MGVRNIQARKLGTRYDCYLRSQTLVRKVNWIVHIWVCLRDTDSFTIIGFLISFQLEVPLFLEFMYNSTPAQVPL